MIPKEIIYEIYSHMGNTDKRRLRQTSKRYDIQFNEKELIEELIEDGYDVPEQYCNPFLIVQYGRLDLCKKVNVENLCNLAAEYGQLKILTWAHENNYAWDDMTCENAAAGHLECLKYLHEHGCPWDVNTCRNAAYGHLECLKYAHEHGCSWNEWTCVNAAASHLEFDLCT